MKGKREVVRNRGKGLYGVKKRRWSDGRRWLGKGVAIMGFVLAVLVWGYYVQFWRKEVSFSSLVVDCGVVLYHWWSLKVTIASCILHNQW